MMMYDKEPKPDELKELLSPTGIAHQIQGLLHMCWIMLPSEKRSVVEVESIMRQIFERVIEGMKQDADFFAE